MRSELSKSKIKLKLLFPAINCKKKAKTSAKATFSRFSTEPEATSEQK